MQLLDLAKDKYKVISVVGMAKNAGKTVTLNELVFEATEKNIKLGITSIGRDGEKQDIVTYTEKPLIYVNEGTLIATAEETFIVSEAKLEILEMTDFTTALGRIIIARAITPGYVQVAGPGTNREIKVVAEKMLHYGAQMVIVDGAIDRKSSASPAVTEATILATGAVLSRDMNKVIEKSAHQVSLFNLDVIEDETIRHIAYDALERGNVCIVNDKYEVNAVDVKTALNSGKIIANSIKEDSRYVILKGSLVAKTLKDIISHTRLYKDVIFIVKDSTKIFIDSKEWQYFMRVGVKVSVLERINVLAVTVNPYSPQGYYFAPDDFLKKMKRILNPLPVLDVMQRGAV